MKKKKLNVNAVSYDLYILYYHNNIQTHWINIQISAFFSVAYAQIDWHDFVVVETVDYQPFETGNFPPPTTATEVGARVLMEERMLEDDGDIEMQIESDEGSDTETSTTVKLSSMENRVGMHAPFLKKDNIQVQDMDEASSDDDSNHDPKMVTPIIPLLPPTHDKVVIKKYDPKQAQKPAVKAPAPDEFLISPITGEKIPASKMAEHMRIGLLDPRWIEQRDKHTVDKLNQDNVCIFCIKLVFSF